MRDLITSLILIIVLTGCNRSSQSLEKVKTVKFRTEIELILDSISIPPVLLHERKIIVNSDYLISMNIDSDTLFRVFDIKKLKYLGSFGIKGRGPDEFNGANISGFRDFGDGCMVTDLTKISFLRFTKGEIRNNNIIFDAKYPIPGSLIPLNFAVFINDTLICGNNGGEEGKELFCFNPKTEEISSVIDYSNLISNAPRGALSQLYRKIIDFSDHQSKFVFSYLLLPLIKICDTEGNTLHEILVEEGPSQRKFDFSGGRLVNSSELYVYYSRVYVSDNHIYALFDPISLKRKEEGSNEYIGVSIYERQLHIFDWSGNPVAKIRLEDWMKEYVPAKDDSYIYFVNPYREDRIYRFPISEYL